jgi:cobalamin biosynthesis Mg chelatase CobN
MSDVGTKRPFTRVAAMPGKLQMTLAACLCAGAVAGCGGSDDGTIPPENGEDMLTRLGALEERVQAGDCTGTAGAVAQAEEIQRLVSELPSSVDDEVREALERSSANLIELTEEQCDEGASGEGGSQTTTTDETTTEETTPTTTTTTTTEETTTTDEDEPSNENQGGGNTGGGGGGGQPGGGNAGGGNTDGGNAGGGGGSGQGDVEIEPPPDSGGIGTGGKAP